MIKGVKELSSAFKGQRCYHRDYLKIIEDYKDTENALIYLDPPYMKQGKQLYRHYMERKQYEEMADLLKNNCKARWLVSHDDHKDFVKLFEGWANITTIEGVPYTINSIHGKRRTELLISRDQYG